MILDTWFLIDVLRGEEAVVDREHELAESTVPVVTAIRLMELREGIQLTDASRAERERARELLGGLSDAAFDRESAMVAGEVSAALADAGTPVDVEDVTIATIALDRGGPVLTGNPDHFDRIEGLAVETYRVTGDRGE